MRAQILATSAGACWAVAVIGPVEPRWASAADATSAASAASPTSAAPWQQVPWDRVLGPAQGMLPPPRAALADPIELPTHRTDTARTRIRWDDDLPAALKVARQENCPVFVTLRCLPCKTCSEFDKDVLEGGPDLDPLFRQFITVRLISAKDVDLRLLPMAKWQDMDV